MYVFTLATCQTDTKLREKFQAIKFHALGTIKLVYERLTHLDRGKMLLKKQITCSLTDILFNTVKPSYNDTGLYNTLPIES